MRDCYLLLMRAVRFGAVGLRLGVRACTPSGRQPLLVLLLSFCGSCSYYAMLNAIASTALHGWTKVAEPVNQLQNSWAAVAQDSMCRIERIYSTPHQSIGQTTANFTGTCTHDQHAKMHTNTKKHTHTTS